MKDIYVKIKQTLLINIFSVSALMAQTWSHQNANQPSPQNIYTISMVSDQIGYLGGASGYLKSTANGGTTWTSKTLGATMQINASSFVSETTGWMVGGGGGIYITTNNATTWSAQSSSVTNHLYGIDMVSNTTGWAAGAGGKVIKTTDGGTTWTSQTTGITTDLRSIDAVSATTAWIAGAADVIKKTTDGGSTWTTLTSGTTGITFVDIFFTDANTGWVVGTSGTIKKTINGGTSWTTQTSGTSVTLRSVHFVSATQGWTVGDNGIILTTTNGGTTWTAQTSGTSETLHSIYMVSSTQGWAVGNAARVLSYCATPAQPGTISGSTLVCPSSSQTYSVTPVANATAYVWTLPSGWTGSSTTNSINVTTGTIGGSIGNVTVKSVSGGCTSSTQSLSVTTISAPSQPSTISGNTTVCIGTNQTYSVTAVAGATSYSWTLPLGWTGSSTTNSITVTVGGNTGSTGISVTANACGNSSIPRNLVVSVSTTPSTPSAISGSQTVCAGTSGLTYSVSSIAGASSYTWTLPSGWSGSSTTNVISSVTAGTSGGNITVTANNSCGSSSADPLAITVNTVPSILGSISGSASVCSGISQTYGISAILGATSYNWTVPNGWIGSSTSSSITTTTGSSGGNIAVTATNSCGTSSPVTLAVSISGSGSAPSSPASISGNNIICSGVAQTYTAATVVGATSYTWTLPSGWTGTSTSNTITVTAGSAGGNISVVSNNSCGSSSATTLSVAVNSAPAAPTTISGSTTVCSGDSETYSVSAVSGATSYTWVLPSGFTGTSTNNTITVTAGSAGGNISVVANNSCGSSSATTLSVAVNSIPATPVNINGSANICAGSLQTYDVISVSGATSYTWVLPSGWTGTSITNIITAIGGTTGGTISVTANNSCGSSSQSTFAVTVNPVPDNSVTLTDNIITATQASANYQWLNCNNSYLPISGANNQSYEATSNGDYAVEINLNGCIDTSICTNITSLAINELTKKSFATVYPNPNNGSFFINFFDKIENGKIEIVNILGQVIFTSMVEEKTNLTINLEAENGIYFVKIVDIERNTIELLKFSKQ